MRSATVIIGIGIGLTAPACHNKSDSPPRVSRVETWPARQEASTRVELARYDADNTARNARDRDKQTLTPLDQSEKKSDLEVTRQIRKLLVRDKSLSTSAKNVKIITVDGDVTLRGPVKSEREREKIVANAKRTAGARNVDDQLESEAKK